MEVYIVERSRAGVINVSDPRWAAYQPYKRAAPFFTHVKPLSEQFGFKNWKSQTVRTVLSAAEIGE